MSSEWQVSPFEYPVQAVADDRVPANENLWKPTEEMQQRMRREQELREAQAREIGRHEGEAQAKVSFDEQLRRERAAIGEALGRFQQERAKYFQQVEGEVVELALAIARKVLHRESQVDPAMLAGLVRYTLEKLHDGTKVVLRVHPRRVSMWQQQSLGECEIAADADVPEESCIIETEVGTTAVGVELELKEIEQGLLDLLGHKPGA